MQRETSYIFNRALVYFYYGKNDLGFQVSSKRPTPRELSLVVRCSKIRILSNNFVVIPKMNIFSIEICLRVEFGLETRSPY